MFHRTKIQTFSRTISGLKFAEIISTDASRHSVRPNDIQTQHSYVKAEADFTFGTLFAKSKNVTINIVAQHVCHIKII